MYNLSKIGRLHIELTTRCNASCPACSRNFGGGPVVPDLVLTELSIDDIKTFFPPGFAKNISAINFCGNLGDPGVALDLLPILEYFQSNSEKNIAQQVRTNGGMRNAAYWKQVGEFFASVPNRDNSAWKSLKESNYDSFAFPAVVFSVDGLEDTNHIYRRGVKWDRLFANMEAYASTGAFGIWEFLVFEHNQHQVEEAKKLANKLGFHFVTKNPMGFGEYQGKPIGMNVYDKNQRYEYSVYPVNFTGERTNIPVGHHSPGITDGYVNKHIPVLTEFSKDLAQKSCIKCKSVNSYTQELYVSAGGYLLPCCFLGGVFGANNTTYSRWQFNDMINKLGLDKFDLRKNNVLDILKGPYFQKFFLDGWEGKPVEDGRLLFCVETCGELSAIDKLYNNKTVDASLLTKE
jgi:MoaA/NifB/PqqE/SkfB family radical SAM enzyme